MKVRFFLLKSNSSSAVLKLITVQVDYASGGIWSTDCCQFLSSISLSRCSKTVPSSLVANQVGAYQGMYLAYGLLLVLGQLSSFEKDNSSSRRIPASVGPMDCHQFLSSISLSRCSKTVPSSLVANQVGAYQGMYLAYGLILVLGQLSSF
jgi:hypothetical protein